MSFMWQFAGSVANKFGDGFGDLELFLRGGGAGIFLNAGSASSMMRAIMETASMGYFPEAVFGGEHDGVGTVEDRVGHVRRLRRAWGGDSGSWIRALGGV